MLDLQAQGQVHVAHAIHLGLFSSSVRRDETYGY